MPVRSADIAELRAFCAAVDLGSLGRAARLLRVSQPALSKRLRALEALSGAQLLERSTRGVKPTTAGSRLYIEARKLLTQAEAVEELMAGLSREDAPVRLAAAHTIAESVLPGPLVAFQAAGERHLSVELIIANSAVVRELVREGRADLGLAAVGVAAAPARDEGLRALPYLDDEVVVFVPADHGWAERDEIALDDFSDCPMIVRDPGADTRRSVDAICADRGISLTPPLAEVGSTSAAKRLALSASAPVLLSRLAVAPEDGLVPRRVQGLSFPRRFALFLPSEATLLPAARALVDHLLDDSAAAREEDGLAITAG